MSRFQQISSEDVNREPPLSGPLHYGKYIVLMKHSDGSPKLLLGPHWYIFILAFLVCCTLLVLMLYSLQNTLANAWFYILSATSIIFAYSYLKIGLSDPGFAHPIPSPTAEQRQNPRFCTSCHTIRSNHTHHCYDCDICIVNYDHHCPWIGKCVGQKNLSSFYFFLLMTFGNLIMCFISTVASAPSRHH